MLVEIVIVVDDYPTLVAWGMERVGESSDYGTSEEKSSKGKRKILFLGIEDFIFWFPSLLFSN